MFAIRSYGEMIGEAWQLDWRITARCAFGNREGMKSMRP
jgi:hypothetical protein